MYADERISSFQSFAGNRQIPDFSNCFYSNRNSDHIPSACRTLMRFFDNKEDASVS